MSDHFPLLLEPNKTKFEERMKTIQNNYFQSLLFLEPNCSGIE